MIETTSCIQCGCKFKYKKNNSSIKINAGKYCSRDCKWKNHSKKIIKYCLTCNKKCLIKRSRKHFQCCSIKCKSKWTSKNRIFTPEWRRKLSISLSKVIRTPEHKLKIKIALRKLNLTGKNSRNWKGGRTKLSSLIRNCSLTKDWRESIFKRDNWTCIFCKKRGCELNVDHIKPFSFIMKEFNIKNMKQAKECKELWDLSNGRTLCVDCHRKTDTYFWKCSRKILSKK